jgi:hypothetical protein
MYKFNKVVTLSILSLIIAIGLMGCGGAKTADNTKTASTGDKIGVAECDEYIEKYEACLNEKVPEAQKATFKSSLDTMRKSWKDAASTPAGKDAMKTGCKSALDQAKTSMASFGCKW